jgi:hypothetical protein
MQPLQPFEWESAVKDTYLPPDFPISLTEVQAVLLFWDINLNLRETLAISLAFSHVTARTNSCTNSGVGPGGSVRVRIK